MCTKFELPDPCGWWGGGGGGDARCPVRFTLRLDLHTCNYTTRFQGPSSSYDHRTPLASLVYHFWGPHLSLGLLACSGPIIMLNVTQCALFRKLSINIFFTEALGCLLVAALEMGLSDRSNPGMGRRNLSRGYHPLTLFSPCTNSAHCLVIGLMQKSDSGR